MSRDVDSAFLSTIGPALTRGDLALVLDGLRGAWPPEQLVVLLRSPSPAVVAVAATCLGMTGSMDHCETLLPLLAREHEEVSAAAEDGLWRLWMSAGSDGANRRLAEAVGRLKINDMSGARALLEELVVREASFAEAHHQLATVYHAAEDYARAESAYATALEHNPLHFAAAAGVGHVRAECGDYPGALLCYRRAFRLNPRLAELGEIIPQLDAAIRKRDVA